ncbi:serine/threonine-protein kinase VRK1 [Rhipicephalus sanguineus]|uniref:Protein kinase domain-containing protein n=1 Tax=Rhipicephalus sanguineus TaxID=34632 RepID=A0A9D4TBQ1_RHISA|nr:serine/threonine-protein kinase VRK1 [Rhipicephalus sanguineus]KAH7984530.1 hypothetical protein HPB52_022228 [Rhipicephalus sanguineus]
MDRSRRSRSYEDHGLECGKLMHMDTFGEGLQAIFHRQGKTFPWKTNFSLDRCVIVVLEYVHSYEYMHAHADIKASCLLLGFGKCNEKKVYLVTFGLASRCSQNGENEEYNVDLRKALDGTFSAASPDGDVRSHSGRGGREILGRTVLQWLCCRLLWQVLLKDSENSPLMENIPLLMIKRFPHGDIPCGITKFLQYAASMKFEDKPDYKQLSKDLEEGCPDNVFQVRWLVTFHGAEDTAAQLVLAKEARAARNNPRRGQHGRERGRERREKATASQGPPRPEDDDPEKTPDARFYQVHLGV